jgi:hypothetical protein
MFILLERFLLREESDFWPYLECLPNIDFMCDWETKEIEACQDPQIVDFADEFRDEVAKQWECLKVVMQLQPTFFWPFLDFSKGSIDVTEEATREFRRAYAQVCTRCFGIAFPQAAMIPMADLLNHSHVHNSVHLMNKRIHLKPLSVQGYYCKELYLTDLQSIYTEEEKAALDLDFIKGFNSE